VGVWWGVRVELGARGWIGRVHVEGWEGGCGPRVLVAGIVGWRVCLWGWDGLRGLGSLGGEGACGIGWDGWNGMRMVGGVEGEMVMGARERDVGGG